MWSWYLRNLSRRPLLTQACSTAVISGIGDVVAQQCVEGRGPREHNWSRTLRYSSVGFVFVGPVLQRWFVQLDKIVGPSLTMKVALRKMLVDQLCFAPVFLACLLPVLWVSQGLQPSLISDRLKQDYPSVLITNYKVWPAAQILNFCFVPLHLRVNFGSIVAVGWNSYLSWRAHRTSHDPHK